MSVFGREPGRGYVCARVAWICTREGVGPGRESDVSVGPGRECVGDVTRELVCIRPLPGPGSRAPSSGRSSRQCREEGKMKADPARPGRRRHAQGSREGVRTGRKSPGVNLEENTEKGRLHLPLGSRLGEQ